jgi:hypothetical protein
MRKSGVLTLLLAGVLTLGATATHAAGGACPSTAQYRNTANPTGPLVTLASLGVTSCFYVADSGADTNSGTTEASPFLHAPFMPNCASACATAQSAFAAGEGIIFRGGDTWHYFSGTPLIGLPAGYPHGTNGYAWRPTVSGTSSNPVYIGVDQTWFTGSSWTRPIITEDNPVFTPSSPNPTLLDSTAVSSCAFPSGNLDAIAFTGTTFYILDNFEWTGMCWNDQTDGGNGSNEHSYIKQFQGGGTGSSPRWFFNHYFHGWSHTRFSCNSITTSTLGSGGSGYAVNDTFGVNGSEVAGLFALGHVTSVSGGVVTGYTITDIGTGYGVSTQSTVRMGAQPGSGSGLTINITATSTITCSGPQAFLGATQQANNGAVMAFNVIDGSDSDDLTFTAFWGDGYDVEENVIRHVGGTNIEDNCHTDHDNLFEFVNNGNDGVGHMDLFFCNSESTQNNFFFNNLVRNIATEYSQAGLSAYFWLNPGAGITDYFFNNVEHDAAFGADQNNLGQPGCCGTGSQVLIYNNTIEVVPVAGNPNFSAFGTGGSALLSVTSQNNHYITNSTVSTNCGKMFTVTTTVNGGVTTCAGDVFQPISAANASGSNSSNDFAINSGSPAFGTGANETSLCSTFGTAFCSTTTLGVSYNATNHTVISPNLAPVLRPVSGACPGVGCWNAGAFNFVPSTVTLTPASYAFAATAVGSNSGDSPVTFTLTNSTGVTVTGVAISFTGANAGDFSKSTSCAATLASSASCQIFVTFTPTATGTRTATLTVSDSDASSPQTSSLSGTAIPSVTNPVPRGAVTFSIAVTDPSIPSTVKNEKRSENLSAYNFDHVVLAGFLHQDVVRNTAGASASQ